jgi:hypothetical protein
LDFIVHREQTFVGRPKELLVSTATIADQSNQLAEQMAGKAPSEVPEVFAREAARLAAEGVAPATMHVRAVQLKIGPGITAGNADGATAIPIPTTLIVDADHAVRWVDLHPNYRTRSEPVGVLAVLDGAVAEPARQGA